MARTLAEAWRQFHSDSPLFVLFLDSPYRFFAPEAEAFDCIEVSQLDIPNLDGFLFKYTILEASTAVKPYFLQYLFRKYSIRKLLYLDPDILIFDSLEGLSNRLDDANVLLTPHLLSPLPADGLHQDDHDILQAGTYNLGFLGLRNSIETRRLLHWWCGKLYHHCLVSIENNLFVDQRWMDLVPALFQGVHILREPGYNVAYWNLHERAVSCSDPVMVNGKSLYFFHFSGFDPEKLWVVSKYQDRFTQNDTGGARRLYSRYRHLLLDNGWRETSGWKYGNDFFQNGVKIPPSARRYYWGLGEDVGHLGNPFQWLNDSSEAQPVARFDLHRERSFLPGVNLMGYFRAETGVGEGARSNWRIIKASGVQYAVNSWIDPTSKNLEESPEKPAAENPFIANLVTVNADQFPRFAKEHYSYIQGHYNIGYWAWELADFPSEWATSFGYVDEVWTPSEFARDAVASHAPVPVRVVPHSLDVNADGAVADRERFGLGRDFFVFLFAFDFHSFVERKNPFGLIASFKKAFGDRKDIQLVLKTVHGDAHREDLRALQTAAGGANILVLDRVLTRSAALELMASADCYISLHRSEGFGLTMAEAMLLGKPVIATAYSGNVDFMTEADSFLVPYRMLTLENSHGPYKAGCHWADPDLDYACDMMRFVEANRDKAAKLGVRAKARVRQLLYPATIGASVRERLQFLGLLDGKEARQRTA